MKFYHFFYELDTPQKVTDINAVQVNVEEKFGSHIK